MSISLKVVSMAYVFWAPFKRSATRMRNRVIFTRLHTGCQFRKQAQSKHEQDGVRHSHLMTGLHMSTENSQLTVEAWARRPSMWPGSKGCTHHSQHANACCRMVLCKDNGIACCRPACMCFIASLILCPQLNYQSYL